MRRYRTAACVCCGQQGLICGRGLINSCYERIRRRGGLHDWPRQTRPVDDLLDDYTLLHRQGYTHRQIADRLGCRLASMRRQLTRARARGLLTRAGT